MNKLAIPSVIMAMSAITASAGVVSPIESDSATAVHSRLLSDFSLTLDEALPLFKERYGQSITIDSLRDYASRRLIEVKTIDGVERVHRKSVRNLALLDRARSGWSGRGAAASPMRMSIVDSIIGYYNNELSQSPSKLFTYRFTIDVPYEDDLEGDTLRVWMPLPFDDGRTQYGVKILSASPSQYVTSFGGQYVDGQDIVHNTIYFEQPVAKGKDAHFEYECQYVSTAPYISQREILEKMRPYDKSSELYRKYTAFEAPHIIDLSALAKEIVGDEKNPLKQSVAVFEYIARNYPWAGAREYSTIECIPQYVIDECHGDCGQVALLYISLMRSLGVPARWESGWMLHPGEKNLHDWAEVYFENVGWVSVDPSFGIYSDAATAEAREFYATGLDSYRLRANKGVCGEFVPAKRFIRSETVDSQMGEVETTKGNLFYPRWSQHLQILDAVPVDGR
jgi:hypothetical protein